MFTFQLQVTNNPICTKWEAVRKQNPIKKEFVALKGSLS